MNNKYSIRTDTWLSTVETRLGEVIRIFQSGFDTKFGSEYIFFTTEECNLHPCSVLLNIDILDELCEGAKVSFGPTLQLAGKSWSYGRDIPAVAKPECMVNNIIMTNLNLLQKNLKLFGKKSVIDSFMSVSGASKVKSFENIQCDLYSKKLNLDNYVEIVGVGEGLTPSVDDFFSGMLLADRFSCNNYICVSECFFNVASNKTTRQSVLQMQFAEQGLLSLKFERFLEKFVSKTIKSAEILQLVNYGHTSGTDILSGVLFYFKNVL